jgi:hypothetical protein
MPPECRVNVKRIPTSIPAQLYFLDISRENIALFELHINDLWGIEIRLVIPCPLANERDTHKGSARSNRKEGNPGLPTLRRCEAEFLQVSAVTSRLPNIAARQNFNIVYTR